MISQGVVLVAFGKREYIYMAALLSATIKRNNDFKISLICDSQCKYIPVGYHQFIDDIIQLEDSFFQTLGTVDPGKAKVSIYPHLPYQRNLYLDVDGICIGDLTPCFGVETFYATQVNGIGRKEDDIDYCIWATKEKIWDFCQLGDDDLYPAIQSSFAVINKSPEAQELFNLAALTMNAFKIEDLSVKWGGSKPDELFFGMACAIMQHNPEAGIRPVYFGHKVHKPMVEVIKDHAILSLYGNGIGRTLVLSQYWEFADKYAKQTAKQLGVSTIEPTRYFKRAKHANTTKF
jgi:hypothetical protein